MVDGVDKVGEETGEALLPVVWSALALRAAGSLT
jgi:hypothetical protein